MGQVDIQQLNHLNHDDEIMDRLHDKRNTETSNNSKPMAHYSKQDILEQYCISEKGMGALENGNSNIFGCLSSYQSSSCSSRGPSSLLTACVRQRVSSEENLYELYKRHPSEYAPFPRKQRYPWSPVGVDMYSHDQDLKSSYFRRKPYADPSRYTWMPSDDESVKMEKPKSIIDMSSYRSQVPSQNKKHVSFARSFTLTSFDDAMSSLNSSSSHLNRITRSQERLLEVRKAEHIQAITKQPEFSDHNLMLLDKVKRGPMKTQATQTDTVLGKKVSGYVSLSPRSMQRVKMVSQAAQTNGINGRKLTKSLSEAGQKFPSPQQTEGHFFIPEHEPLQRTQSDEPPRSPFLDTSSTMIIPPPEDLPQSESSSVSRSEDHASEDSVEAKKEIFIDFKPQVPLGKKPLVKTFSDGVILMEKRKAEKSSDDCVVPNIRTINSMSHETIPLIEEEGVKKFTPRFQKVPIKNEGICKPLEECIFSSIEGSLPPQDSIDEEFHENIIYSTTYDLLDTTNRIAEAESIVPSIYLRTDLVPSPFASNDSLTNDTRDHSDNIWNESQVTVLQVESCSDTATPLFEPPNLLLTPSAKRKHMLMVQHQQRSSIDTEALEEEVLIIEQENKISGNKLKVPNTLHVQSSSYLKVKTQRSHSPLRRRKMSESPPVPAESPLPAVVPDLLLARTDSCKTNTDLSESTTTDDYITANSGTDSSRKSASVQGFENQLQKQNVSKTPEEVDKREPRPSLDTLIIDDMVVPSISPSISSEPPYALVEVHRSTPVPQIRTGRSTPSEDSSSCGSYSVGSTPDLLDRYHRRHSTSKVWSDDEEERSVQYSSSGYYESPIEDGSSTNKREEYVTKKRREFQLELTNPTKPKTKPQMKISPKKECLKVNNEKVKRTKTRTRSPLQGHKKAFQGRKSPHKDKSSYSDDRSYKATSDESSTGREYGTSQTSPRKSKKSKEGVRRKSLPRSPVSQKSQKNSISQDFQPSSLPGSLSRRKSSKAEDRSERKSSKTSDKVSTITSPKETTLKALSAESLRSVSPGSDSVFYSDPSTHTTDHQIHCLHCGKEVEVQMDEDKNGQQPVIVQPPAGFEDSPKIKGGRFYKKLDKRLKSEDKNDQKRNRYKPDIRAKSEERSGGAGTSRGRLRPMQRSPYCSKEQLKTADSSPSILPGAPEEDNDQGIYIGCYGTGKWLCINEAETVQSISPSAESESFRRGSTSSTESEIQFRKKYDSVAHRVIHRKPYVDMYKRLYSQSFDQEDPVDRRADIKGKLEEVLKLMLSIWCRENRAVRLICDQTSESDKTIVVQRQSGEFGFRIHGSKPVVVTAIESGTPAESSGLEVGDIIISVNGINVLDRSHSDVVQIAHAGSDTLTLEVARTSFAINASKEYAESAVVFSGYLWKLNGYAKGSSSNKWLRRWFCLKKDNCLYYYKTDSDKQPVGVMMLFDQEVQELENSAEPVKSNKFVIHGEGAVPLFLAADSIEERTKWVELIEKCLNECQSVNDYLEDTKRNLTLSPSAIDDPDCFGYLVKLGTQWNSWNRRYCVLKDAALYFYHDANSTNAFGVALLHGYKVQQSSSSKKHAFEIVPPDPAKKHYYFHAESDTDRRRWIASLEYSIDRWLNHDRRCH